MRLKLVGIALLFLFALDDFSPFVTLVLIPHESAAAPDPHSEPLQGEVSTNGVPWNVRRHWTDFRLQPRASYDISARVVDHEVFRLGTTAALMPVDLGLAWGRLVDEPYRSGINYSHVSRFLAWSTSDPSFDMSYVASHAANVHLVSDNWRVAAALSRVRAGDLVRLEGDLVDITGPDGFVWKTSLTRTDTGPGACETIYVRAVTIGERRYH